MNDIFKKQLTQINGSDDYKKRAFVIENWSIIKIHGFLYIWIAYAENLTQYLFKTKHNLPVW